MSNTDIWVRYQNKTKQNSKGSRQRRDVELNRKGTMQEAGSDDLS